MQIKHSVVLAALFAGSALVVSAQPTVTVPSSSVPGPNDAGVRVHTNIKTLANPGTQGLQPQLGGPPFLGLFYQTPAAVACIYNLVQDAGKAGHDCNPNVVTLNPTGGSKSIAIVDAFDDPNAATDLAAFSIQFGLPPANFSVVYAPFGDPNTGACLTTTGTQPVVDPTGGWEIEESLDIQWAHAMAPKAAVYLVEAQTNNTADLLCGVTYASALLKTAGGGDISMSWGSGEFQGEMGLDFFFSTPGVVYFASAGDSPGASWPSVSANVVSVGGTTLSRDPVSGAFLSENTWQDAGSGPSGFVPRPVYQNNVKNVVGGARGTPDMAAVANPNTGVWVLDDFVVPEFGTTLCGAANPHFPPTPCWLIVGGTSVSSPMMAGIINAAGSFSASSAAELTKVYGGGGGFNNINQGSCGPYIGYFAQGAYSFCTGIGTPKGYSGK